MAPEAHHVGDWGVRRYQENGFQRPIGYLDGIGIETSPLLLTGGLKPTATFRSVAP